MSRSAPRMGAPPRPCGGPVIPVQPSPAAPHILTRYKD